MLTHKINFTPAKRIKVLEKTQSARNALPNFFTIEASKCKKWTRDGLGKTFKSVICIFHLMGKPGRYDCSFYTSDVSYFNISNIQIIGVDNRPVDACGADDNKVDVWQTEVKITGEDPLSLKALYVTLKQTFKYDKGFKNHILYFSYIKNDLKVIDAYDQLTGLDLEELINKKLKENDELRLQSSLKLKAFYQDKILKYLYDEDIVPTSILRKREESCNELGDI
ncbi:hypothetical protein ACOME3_007947 [Neoechinorhynchus agilis]